MLKSLLMLAAALQIQSGAPPEEGQKLSSAPDLRINQIQVLGTHNSYGLGVDPALMAMVGPKIEAALNTMKSQWTPAALAEFKEYHPNDLPWSEGLAYAYPEGLAAQLDAGLRSLELDVNLDPEGGRFLRPGGYQALASRPEGAEGLLPHDAKDLEKPGYKVLHIQDIDFRSSCNLFRTCLKQIRSWSDAHRDHAPIFILIEAKEQSIPLFPSTGPAPRFDVAAFDALDREILDVIPRDRIVAPDDVRGGYPTLEAGVLAQNWPRLKDSRGKFVFLLLTALDTQGLSAYRQGRPNLEGRVAFLRSKPGQGFSAFLLLDNADVRGAEIREYVQKGYLVRARADIETFEAKVNDLSRARNAFESGAQVISTDFYKPGNAYRTDYVVRLPGGGEARCNPVNSEAQC
jgi:hypothetical protein